jgi:hypothetical protein
MVFATSAAQISGEAVAAPGNPRFAATPPSCRTYGWTTPSITFGAAVTVGLAPI